MRSRPVHGWRKVASAAWGPPTDPQIYGDLDVDAAALLAYADQLRRETGVHVTVTHLVGRAIAHAIAANPDVNGVLRHGRFRPRESVDVFFIATIGGDDLSGVKVGGADRKSAVDVAAEVSDRVAAMTEGRDPEFGRTKRLLTWAPLPLLRATVALTAWLSTDRERDLPRLGVRRHPFGSAMVSSVGMFGIGHAYAPLAAFYRVPLLVLVGEVAQRPVAVEGLVVVRPVLPLAVTIDHRYVDVAHAARLAAAVRDYCRDPAAFEPEPRRIATQTASPTPASSPPNPIMQAPASDHSSRSVTPSPTAT